MNCNEILKKHKVSVIQLSNMLNMTRQHLYRLMKEYDDGNRDNFSSKLQWCFDLIFENDDCTNEEFNNKLIQIKEKMNELDTLGKKISKEAFAIGYNSYITKNHIRTFEYKLINKEIYELKINGVEIYNISKQQLKTFLYMYDL